jgi:hypothetical protein
MILVGMPSPPSRIVVLLILAGTALGACGIAETKLPPDPTVEYLPCTGMDLDVTTGHDPATLIRDSLHEMNEDYWGGSWTVGSEWHVGLTDVGVVDWQAVCPRMNDPSLVIHEVPFVLDDLELWAARVEEKVAGPSGEGGSANLVVLAGQYVVEVRAESVEEASALTEGIPLDAWVYGGPVSSGSG